MISYRDLYLALESLQIQKHTPVLVLSEPMLGKKIHGGEKSALSALMAIFDTMMMPAFTSSPIIVPQNGPENNALDYESNNEVNQNAEFFTKALEPDEQLGNLVRHFMKVPDSKRSDHPLLSFAGLGVDAALLTQTIDDPWAPIRELYQMEGWVLLFGIEQNRNICFHLAEKQAGKKQFVRWALTREGIIECHEMPGCTKAFSNISIQLIDLCKRVLMPSFDLVGYPIRQFVDRAQDIIANDLDLLLCSDPLCPFCSATRKGRQSKVEN